MNRKRMLLGTWSAVFIAITVGCGGKEEPPFEPNVFSERDMCIVKSQEEDSRICYGMSREEAERITGGISGDQKPGAETYEGGVRLTYREDRIVGIDLLEESLDHYRTARGAQVGMSRQELAALYGDRYIKPESPGFLVYYYDVKKKELLPEMNAELMTASRDETTNWYTVSIKLTGDEKAEFISLMDRRRAVYMD